MSELSDQEFGVFQALVLDAAGINLSGAKKALVAGRLSSRLRTLGIDSYSDYLDLLGGLDGAEERQRVVDLLTTNETYFFREEAHFARLRQAVSARTLGATFRVWSAASSTGEEAYSVAMILAETIGGYGWEILGTDVSTRVVATARRGQYPESRATHLPDELRRRYCLRGTGAAEGTLLVDRTLRERVTFRQLNLNAELPELGAFDVIFLRNVLIYFALETKRQVVRRVTSRLKPGGLLLIGHAETLGDVPHRLHNESPSVYRAPERAA